MNKLNQWLTLTANLAVVAGIIMLAVEIRQNTDAVQVNTAQALTSEMATWNRMRAEHGAAEISVQVVEQGYESLSAVQVEQYNPLINAYFYIAQNAYLLFQQGHLDPTLMPSRHRGMVYMLSHSGPLAVWQMSSMLYNDEFREYIETVVIPEALVVQAER
ncbi:MAG: hypothetical protein V7746_14830 [Halioglobus sp.]